MFYRSIPVRTILSVSLVFIIHLAIGQQSLKTFKDAKSITAVGDAIYIRASMPIGNDEFWVSDGTPEGTRAVPLTTDPYERPRDIGVPVSFNGQAFFSAFTEHYGTELWKSDGTLEGTVMVKDLTQPGSWPRSLTVVNNLLYFITIQGKLYKTDGTSDGTLIIDEDVFNLSVAATSEYLYYFKGTEIRRTDGTTVGSVPAPSDFYFDESLDARKLISAGDNIFLLRTASSTELQYRLSVLQPSTTWAKLKDFTSSVGINLEDFTAVGNKLFFDQYTWFPNVGSTDTLWVTDGTMAGTKKAFYSATESGKGNSIMDMFVNYNGQLFFRGANTAFKALWKSDGTEAGTVKIHDVAMMTDAYDAVNPPVVSEGLLWFSGDLDQFGSNKELWFSDGTTSGTRPYVELDQSSGSLPHFLTDANGKLYFATGSYNVTSNVTIWNSDPAPELNVKDSYGTPLITDAIISFTPTPINDCQFKELTIENTGKKHLVIKAIKITGNNFYLKGSLPSLLAPSSNATFQVYYSPITNTKGNATMLIETNDSDESIFKVRLRSELSPSEQLGFCESFGDELKKEINGESGAKSIVLSNATVGESLPIGTLVGTLSVASKSDPVLYSFVSGEGDQDNMKFELNGDQLKSNDSFSTSVKSTYVVRLKAQAELSVFEDYFVISVVASGQLLPEEDCRHVAEFLLFTYGDIEMNSHGQLFAVSNDGRILRSLDNGVAWETVYSGNSRTLNNITFKEDIGYVTGENVLLKSEDAGNTWFKLYVPVSEQPNNPHSIYFLEENSGYLCSSNGELFYTPDGGRSWELRYSDPTALQKLWFFNEDVGFAIKGSNSIVKTIDGGKTWQPQTVYNPGIGNSFTGLWFLNQEEGFATSNFGMFHSGDAGRTWTRVINNTVLNGIEFRDSKIGFAYGGDVSGILLRTSDGGATWTDVYDTQNGGVVGIATSTQNQNVFTAHMPLSLNGRSLHFSNNGTDDWVVLQELQAEEFNTIDFKSKTEGFLCSSYSRYKTTDGGMSWKKTPFAIRNYSQYFFDENNGILSDGVSIYKTSNGGEAMELLYQGEYPLGKLVGINDNLIFAYNLELFYRSTDKGVSWQLDNLTQFADIDIHLISETLGYRLSVFGTVAKTTNGGATWQQIFTHDPNSTQSFTSIFFVNESIGYKAGRFVEKTTDGGVTWSPVSTRFDWNVIDLYFVDELHGYAVESREKILVTIDGGLSWKPILFVTGAYIADANFQDGTLYYCGGSGFGGRIANKTIEPTVPAYIFGPQIVCPNDAQLYHLPNDYSVGYKWSIDKGSIESNQSTVRATFDDPGDYTIEVKQINGCGISEPRILKVTAQALEAPIISGLSVVASLTRGARYEVVNDDPLLVYAWDAEGEISSTVNDRENEITVNWTAEYPEAKVSVFAIDQGSGCRVRTDFPVNIDITVGVDDELAEMISVYPNPTSDEIMFKSSIAKSLALKLYDSAGNEWFSTTIEPYGETKISLKNAASGVWILRVVGIRESHTYSAKIVKK